MAALHDGRHGVAAVLAVCVAVLAAGVAADASQSQPFKPIVFQERTYDCFKYEKIDLGAGAYFVPRRQKPDAADDMIIFNYYTKPIDPPLTEERAAVAVVQRTLANGGNLVAKFRAPDPLDKSAHAYFVYFFYVYPDDRQGDVWMTKLTRSGDTVVGVNYRHRVHGRDADTIGAHAKEWLVRYGKPAGLALGSLAIPHVPDRLAPTEPADPRG